MKSKISLNLTPILDLLLILLFAYQVNNLLTSKELKSAKDALEKDYKAKQDTLETYKSNEVALRKQIENLNEKNRDLDNKLKDLEFDNISKSKNIEVMSDYLKDVFSNANIDDIVDTIKKSGLDKNELKNIADTFQKNKTIDKNKLIEKIYRDNSIKKLVKTYYIQVEGKDNFKISVSETDEKLNFDSVDPLYDQIERYLSKKLKVLLDENSNKMQIVFIKWGSCKVLTRDHVIDIIRGYKEANNKINIVEEGMINAK